MNKKIAVTILFLSFPFFAFAHPGRLDGQGGHRVNKEWKYEGRYIVVKDKVKYLQSGEVFFKEGDYHFHCKPDRNGFKDGIYIPSDNVRDTQTSNIAITKESVVASINSDYYHKPDCPIVKNIKEENIIIFEDKEDAEKSGYVPHGKCKAAKIGD